jgi:hypothetical protein
MAIMNGEELETRQIILDGELIALTDA